MQPNNALNFDKKSKVLGFLTMLYYTINLIGIPVTYKLIAMGPLVGPGGLAILPFIFLLEDIIVEIYGYKVSRYLLWMIFASTIIFSLAVVFIVHLPSPSYWHSQANYDAIFDPILKTAPAAVLAMFIGRFANIILMTKWKILLKGRFFWLRSVFSTLLGSAIALAVFFLLSFWGSVPIIVIEKLFLSDLIVRLSYTIIGGIPVAFLVSYLKRKLGLNVVESNINFNPFSLDTKNKT